jgi:hypothetical protein
MMRCQKNIFENKLLAINNKSKFSYLSILISICHLNYNEFVLNANSYKYQWLHWVKTSIIDFVGSPPLIVNVQTVNFSNMLIQFPFSSVLLTKLKAQTLLLIGVNFNWILIKVFIFNRGDKSELTEDLINAEKRVDIIKQTCINTEKKITSCLQTVGGGIDSLSAEKRLKKMPEMQLYQCFAEFAELLGTDSVLG